jgi:hypothetical protein
MTGDHKTKRVFVPVSASDHAAYMQVAWRTGLRVAELARRGLDAQVTPADRSAAAKRTKRLEK